MRNMARGGLFVLLAAMIALPALACAKRQARDANANRPPGHDPATNQAGKSPAQNRPVGIAAPTPPPRQVRTKAPDFTLTDQRGDSVRLSSFLGKTVILEWVNWDCPAVKRHYETGNIPDLAADYLREDEEGQTVYLAINSTPGATREMNISMAAQYELMHPILTDADGGVARAFGATATPYFVVVDIRGEIAYQGAIDDDPAGKKDLHATNYVQAAMEQVLIDHPVAMPKMKPYGSPISQGVTSGSAPGPQRP